jgi:hypothetical protein
LDAIQFSKTVEVSLVGSGLLHLTGGADRDRTGDLRLAKPALSQLSYSPSGKRMYPPRPLETESYMSRTLAGVFGFDPFETLQRRVSLERR